MLYILYMELSCCQTHLLFIEHVQLRQDTGQHFKACLFFSDHLKVIICPRFFSSQHISGSLSTESSSGLFVMIPRRPLCLGFIDLEL